MKDLLCILLAAVVLTACNDDDDKDTVTGPTDATALDQAVFTELSAAVQQAVGLIFVGGGTVPGAGGGQIVVTGVTFRFEEYSPDGEFFLDGELAMDILASPIAVTGELTYRNAEEEGPIVVDMTIDSNTDPPTYGGTVLVDGEPVDVAAANQ